MAKGFPDFFGQSIFPTYGPVLQATVTVAHSASGDTDTILTITGKGLIRTIYLEAYNTNNDGDLFIRPQLSIDSVLSTWLLEHDVSSPGSEANNRELVDLVLSTHEDSHVIMVGNVQVPFISAAYLEVYCTYAVRNVELMAHILYSLYQ